MIAFKLQLLLLLLNCNSLRCFITTLTRYSFQLRVTKGTETSKIKTDSTFDAFDSVEEEMEWMPDSKLVELATKVDERLTNVNKKSGRKFKAAEILDDDENDVFDLDGQGYDMSPKAWDDHQALSQVTREEGFLGDCTLQEISMDYSVPMFYLADVLCSWGVPPPIEVDAKLGDLVIGEQAFSILEALTSFDPADMYAMFSDSTLASLADNYGDHIQLRELYQVAVSEGFSLPFGVHSRLRHEYVEILDRYFDPDSYWDGDDYDKNFSSDFDHDGLDSYY